MLGKLSVAFLIVASPAAAQDAPPAPSEPAIETETPVAYKTKRVCRSIEVVGSTIPRRACSTKRIPIKPVESESETDAAKSATQKEPDAGQ